MTEYNFLKYRAPVILSSINIISLCSAIITLILILTLVFYRRNVLDRVTIRFQGIIALIDIVRHINMNSKYSANSICKFIAFFSCFLDHLYIFINVLITLNMQLIYIHNFLPKPLMEIFYIFGATILAFIIDLIPFAYGVYGKNQNNICYLIDPHPYRFIFKILLKYLTITPGLIYCVVLFLWIVISLYLRRNYVEEKFPSRSIIIFGETVNGQSFIKKLYFRMALYPISSFASFFPYLTANIYRDIFGYDIPGRLFFVVRICTRLTGLMNLLSLLIDPHFQLAIKNIYRHGLVSNQQQAFNIGLNDLSKLKRDDEEYLIDFPGEEKIKFEDYIKLL